MLQDVCSLETHLIFGGGFGEEGLDSFSRQHPTLPLAQPHMSTSLLRTSSTLLRQCQSRSLSTSRGVFEQALPDAKLRLLISLHHQAKNFITMDNLDAAILKAFLPDNTDPSRTKESLRFPKLQVYAEKPKEGSSFASAAHNSALVHGGIADRDTQIHSALYGSDAVGSQAGLPGLEIIREEMEAASATEEKPNSS